jgi:hypothetical protein
MEGVTNKDEKIFFVTKLDLFTLETITLLELEIHSVAIFCAKVGTKDLIFNLHFEG